MVFRYACVATLLIGGASLESAPANAGLPVRASRPASAGNGSQYVDELLKRAESLVQAKRYADAIHIATEAIRLRPEDARGYRLRGIAAYRTLNRRNVSFRFIQHDGPGSFRRFAPLKEETTAHHDLHKAILLGVNDVETRINYGLVLLWQYEYEQALPIFNQALKEVPRNVEALVGRAHCRMVLNDVKGGLRDIDQAIVLDGHCVDALLNRGAANCVRRRFRAVITDMNNAIRLQPRNIHAFNMRSVAYMLLGDYDNSLRDAQEAHRLRPFLVLTLANLSGIYLKRNEPKKALPYLKNALRWAESRNDRRAVHNNRAAVYYELGRFDLALADANECIKLSKSIPEKIAAYQNRTYSLTKLGLPNRAKEDNATVDWLRKLQHLQQAHQKSPKDLPALFSLAAHLWSRDRWKDAIACYDKAIAVDAKNLTARIGRAVLSAKLGRHDVVIKDCDVLIGANARDLQYYLLRGNAHLAKKNYDRAIADFTKGRAFGDHVAAAYFGRGKAHQAAGRLEYAAEDLQQARNLNPQKYGEAVASLEPALARYRKSTKALLDRAKASLKLGRLDAVIADCDAVIRRAPRSREAYQIRGSVYLKKKDYDRAIKDFTRGGGFNPQFALAYMARGKAHLAAGRTQAAAEDFRRAVSIDSTLKTKLVEFKPIEPNHFNTPKNGDDVVVPLVLSLKSEPTSQRNPFRPVEPRTKSSPSLPKARDRNTMQLSRTATVATLIGTMCSAASVAEDARPVRAHRPASATRIAGTAKRLFQRAEALNRAEQYDAAIEVATKAIAVAPKNPRGYHIRATAATNRRDYSTGGPGTMLSTTGPRGTIQVQAGVPAKKRSRIYDDLQKAIRRGDNDVDTRAALARALLAQNENLPALALFNGAIRDEPKNIDVLVGRALCRLGLNDLKGSLQDANAAVTFAPKRVKPLVIRAVANIANQQHHAASIDATQAIRLDPKCSAAYQMRGVARVSLRQFNEAKKDMLTAIRLAPRHRESLCHLSEIFLVLGEPAKSLPYLKRALACSKRNYEKRIVLKYRLRIHTALKQFDKALIDATSMLELSETTLQKAEAYESRSKVHNSLGHGHWSLLDSEAAKRLKVRHTIEMEIQQAPGDVRPLVKLANHYLAAEQWDEAKPFYDKATAIDARCLEARQGRAAWFLAQGRHDDAIADCTVALGFDPKSTTSYLLRGKAFLAKKHYDAAISDFTKGRAFGAEFAAAYLGRAKAHRAAGRKKEADEDLRRAEFLNPTLSK